MAPKKARERYQNLSKEVKAKKMKKKYLFI